VRDSLSLGLRRNSPIFPEDFSICTQHPRHPGRRRVPVPNHPNLSFHVRVPISRFTASPPFFSSNPNSRSARDTNACITSDPFAQCVRELFGKGSQYFLRPAAFSPFHWLPWRTMFRVPSELCLVGFVRSLRALDLLSPDSLRASGLLFFFYDGPSAARRAPSSVLLFLRIAFHIRETFPQQAFF